MAALAAPRYTQQVADGPFLTDSSYPIADNVKIYEGGIVVLSGGYAAPGSAALGLTAVGIAHKPQSGGAPGPLAPAGAGVYDNTIVGHAAGAFQVHTKPGVFPFDNSAAGDAIAQANVGNACFLVDDHTVALTDGQGTRSPAGAIMGLDANGQVLVSLGLQDGHTIGSAYPQSTISIPIAALSTVATNDVLARFTPGFAGRIKSISFFVTTAVTTAAKLATLAASIAGTPTTGGAVALTSANCTPKGATVAGSALTALNTFTAAQEITLVATAVTAFVEGAGVAVITLG